MMPNRHQVVSVEENTDTCARPAIERDGITDPSFTGKCAIQICGTPGTVPSLHNHVCCRPECINCVHSICAGLTGLHGESENHRFCSFYCKDLVSNQ